MTLVLSVNLEFFLITANYHRNSRILSVHKYHQVEKNRCGDLGEHVRAMTGLRNAFRRAQEKNEGKNSLG